MPPSDATQRRTRSASKQRASTSYEVVFGSLDAFLAALESAEVMIQRLTHTVAARGRGTGVLQRHYGIHLTALGPVPSGATRPAVYYCTILAATQATLDNRPFCPPMQARAQHEQCLQRQQAVYDQLVERLRATAGVIRVLEDARVLVRAPWESPIAWQQEAGSMIEVSPEGLSKKTAQPE